ncbi:MAG: hypothetical protein V3S02_01415 [Dehalococcoidales bacterium]
MKNRKNKKIKTNKLMRRFFYVLVIIMALSLVLSPAMGTCVGGGGI